MEQVARPTSDSVSSSGSPSRGLRILFADDDDAMGQLVRRFLELAGHSVRPVRDGQEAVDAARAESFDVVLLDLLMPTMDGIEAATRIRAEAQGRGKRLTIIAATAQRLEALQGQFEEGLFDAVLSKPVQASELARVIASLAG